MCAVTDILETSDPCNKNIGGTTDEIYYALLGDFATIPDLPLNESVLADKFVIDTAVTFKTGKCWKKIQIKKETGKLDYESVGNAGALQPVLTFSIPGNNLGGMALNNLADNNTPFVFLVQTNDMPDGHYNLLGNFEHKVTLKGGKNGGEKAGDGGMYNFEVRGTQKFEMHYTAAVSFTPAA